MTTPAQSPSNTPGPAERRVVTYTCSRCGATTDSTKENHGWAWGKGEVLCPKEDMSIKREK